MNKEILFIDEKPFHPDYEVRAKAELQFNNLKYQLQEFGGIEIVEFFFESNPDRKLPREDEYNTKDFKELIEDRKYIVIHNSFPDSKDPNPIMSDADIKIFRTKLNKYTKLIRFSGSIHLRVDGFYKDEPKIKHLAYNRDILYSNFDVFVRYLKLYGFENPFYSLIEYGNDAFSLQAMNIQSEIQDRLFVETQSFAQMILKEKTDVKPKEYWKNLVGDDRFRQLCLLTNWNNTKINNAINKVKSKKDKYQHPNEYLKDISAIVEKTKERTL